MTNITHFNRPALAAIAAALAFSTAPAGAQPADDATATPSVAPAPSEAPAPAPEPEANVPLPVVQPAPVQIAPSAPVVQSLPTPSTADVAQSRAAAAPPRAAQPRAAQASQPARVTAPAVAAAPVAPVTAPVPAEAVSPSASTAAVPTDAPLVLQGSNGQTESAWWVLGGAGLLFAGGLGALAWSRSRRRLVPARDARTKDRAPAATANKKTAPALPAAFGPVAVPAEASLAVEQPVEANATKTAAKTAHAPSASKLEKMVAAKPSTENPFVTRKARLRRAKYILEHGAPQPLTPEAAEKVSPKEQSQSKPQPVYNFSKAKKPTRRNWKPATT